VPGRGPNLQCPAGDAALGGGWASRYYVVMSSQVEPVVVAGAGVSGLTTAICLAEAGHDVKVWAADPPRHTTSVVAGALWGPSFQEPVAKTLAWTQQSLHDFTVLADDPGSGCGWLRR
jgi:D-amino-acid oxidase